MGFSISALFYLIYVLLTCVSMVSFSKGHVKLFAGSYFMLLHINVTSFSNVGIAWTGDLIIMAYVLLNYMTEVYSRRINNGSLRVCIGGRSNIVFAFWILLASSVLCSLVREMYLIGDYGFSPFVRSLKSFVKFSLYAYAAILIARKLSWKVTYGDFVNCLSFSGLLPSLAVLYQTFGTAWPMFLYHNNNTFTQNPKMILYDGARGVGLSDESSFFALCITFSFIGSLAGLSKFRGTLKYAHAGMISVQFLAIALSLSRTGMLGIACAAIVFYGQRSLLTTLKAVAIATILILIVNYASIWAGVQFSLFERFTSIFNVEYSASNVERYGIAASLWGLLWTGGAICGYGFFNYMYYISDHLPPFMQMMHYDSPEKIPSFNLIIQLLAEVGVLQSLIFAVYVMYVYWRRRKNFSGESQSRQLVSTTAVVALISAMSVNVFAFGMPFVFVILLNVAFRPEA